MEKCLPAFCEDRSRIVIKRKRQHFDGYLKGIFCVNRTFEKRIEMARSIVYCNGQMDIVAVLFVTHQQGLRK